MLKINMNSELIKKFYKIIREITDKIENEKYEDALLDIENAFKDFFRLGSKFFNSLSEENLLDMIKTNNIMDINKCIIMSKLLMEEGIVYERLYGSDKSFYIYQKSLFLYIEACLILEEEAELNVFFQDIETLLDKVSDYKLTLKLQKQIISYYLKEALYADAENVLYELLEDAPKDAAIKEYAISFYNSLLLKSDSELNKGRLPREEILESLNSLE